MTWSFTDDYDERYYKDYDLASLRMDEFYLSVNVSSDQKLCLYTLNKECFEVRKDVKFNFVCNGTTLFPITIFA